MFVARIPGLAEEANGWQAFFLSFLKFFFTLLNRGLGGYHLRSGLTCACSSTLLKNGNAAEQSALRR